MGKIATSINLAFKNLRANTGRTFLSLTGVVIGITSVMIIVSAGEGVKNFILGQVGSFGTDIIQVEIKVPSTGKTSGENAIGQAQGIQITTMKIGDAKVLEKVANIKYAAAGTMAQELITYKRTNKRSFILGVGAQYFKVDKNNKLAGGYFFDESDDNSLRQVVVIGSGVRESFFGDQNPLGKNIKLKDQNYEVIGFLEPRGMVAGFDYDDIVYVPVQTVQKKILGVDFVRFIMLKTENEKIVDETVYDLILEMRRLHDITDPARDDFAVTSIKEAQEIVNDVFGTINIFLLAITSISLIVGGVGIMNVMYVAVAERTFEIGLRKAVGAGSDDILRQFLWEAIFITFFGGVIGIIFGLTFTFILSYIFSLLGFGLNLGVNFNAIFLAVGFATIIGIVFGYYPARSAARLSPMEALRKE